jgi:hypothetical protein
LDKLANIMLVNNCNGIKRKCITLPECIDAKENIENFHQSSQFSS